MPGVGRIEKPTLSAQRQLVAASRRWDKKPTGSKAAYLQSQVGAVFGQKTPEAWKSILKRAKQDVEEAEATRKAAKYAKAEKHGALRQKCAEVVGVEEITHEEAGVWMLQALVRLPLIVRAVGNIQNLAGGMRRETTARKILSSLGYGNAFLNLLIRWTLYVSVQILQPDLLDPWELHCMGEGTDDACFWLTGKVGDLGNMVFLYSKLEPAFKWVVEATLGDDWVTLVTFHMFQHLLCEWRAYEKQTRGERKETNTERQVRYNEHLDFFLLKAKLSRTSRRRQRERPKLDLPSNVNRAETLKFLRFFSALVLRFSVQVLKRPFHGNLYDADTLYATRRFQTGRINQWLWQLDRGSLAAFRVLAAATSSSSTSSSSSPSPSPSAHDIWAALIPRAGLCCSILADGEALWEVVIDSQLPLCSAAVRDATSRAGLDLRQHPYGRAINVCTDPDPMLTGNWNDA